MAASMLSGGAAALTASGAPAAMLPLDVFYLQVGGASVVGLLGLPLVLICTCYPRVVLWHQPMAPM